MTYVEIEEGRYQQYPIYSLTSMFAFLGAIIISVFMFSTPSGEYHLPKAVCFLAVPAFLALWIYFVIKALKSVSLSFWRLKSTIACAIGLGIVVVLAIGLVFYIITVQPEARGSIVPFVIAVLIALSGLAIFIFYSNYNETRSIPLTVSTSVLQLLVFVLAVAVVLLWLNRDRRSPAQITREFD